MELFGKPANYYRKVLVIPIVLALVAFGSNYVPWPVSLVPFVGIVFGGVAIAAPIVAGWVTVRYNSGELVHAAASGAILGILVAGANMIAQYYFLLLAPAFENFSPNMSNFFWQIWALAFPFAVIVFAVLAAIGGFAAQKFGKKS